MIDMKILFATGGTAGHINPALAVASYIREERPDTEILFIGTAEKMESRLVPEAGFDFKTIEIQGFMRSLSMKGIKTNIDTLLKLLKASTVSKKIIADFAPDVVVGFGGYVSGPVLNTATKMGIKTCIHEQNAFPGITNKALAKKVDKVMLTVEDAAKLLDSKNPVEVTGLPVRGEILKADRDFARAELGIRDDQIVVLSTGGSLGARPINEAMLHVMIAHANNPKIHHIHSTGANDAVTVSKLKEAGVYGKKNIDCREYINNMDVCLAAADLVIGRAGASSLSELQAMGKASILVPSPYVAENHQYHNAMALVNRGAAIIIEEKDLTNEKMLETVDSLIDNTDKLSKFADNAKAMAIDDAREKISQVILNLATSK